MIKEFFKSIYKRGNRFINPHNKIPLTRNFGFYRGTPIDRYFINKWIYDFLDEIDSGNKLKGIEIGGFDYLKYNSKKYLANELVPKRELKKSKDSLCINLNEPINKDFKLKEKYDFVICTQVLHVLENDINGLRIIYKLLKKGGLIIGSTAGTINPISIYDYKRWGCYRGYSDQGLKSILEKTGFECQIETFGNFALAYEILNGAVVEDIDQSLFKENDEIFQILHLFKAYKN